MNRTDEITKVHNHIGFTGTQEGMTSKQRNKVKSIVRKAKVNTVHHGDCIGADEQFHNIATSLGIVVHIHPPKIASKRAFCLNAYMIHLQKPYLERNKDIVNSCDLLIAAPKEKEEQLRSGTWATIRYTRKQKKDHVIVFPDGTTQKQKYKKEGLLK